LASIIRNGAATFSFLDGTTTSIFPALNNGTTGLLNH
jgi:hypothetical protein